MSFVTAIIVTRNDAPYLPGCLSQLIAGGLDYVVIDNESEDETADILRRPEFRAHLRAHHRRPYPGHYAWSELLAFREEVARKLDSEWVLFVDTDEVIQSYREDEPLAEAIARIAREGADVIDCDEFVFLPVDTDYPDFATGLPPLRD